LGIPHLVINGDLNDLRCFSEEQTVTNIEAFVEQIESRTVKIYAGIDIGSCTTKAVVIDEQGNLLGSDVRRSGIDYKTVARESLETALTGKSMEGVRSFPPVTPS